MEVKKKFKAVTDAELKDIRRMLSRGESIASVAQKYGYHRESIRRWWLIHKDDDKSKELRQAYQRRGIIETAFGDAELALRAVKGKEDDCYAMALDELKWRLSENRAKGFQDRDLLAIISKMHDIISERTKSVDQPSVQNNTQNIINVFSEAIEQSIKEKNE